MLEEPLHRVSHEDVQALVDTGRAESRRLEYEERLPSPDSRGRRESWKDVTAMANPQGGDIVYGAREARDGAGMPTGVAGTLVGLGDEKLDQVQVRLTTQGSPAASFGLETEVSVLPGRKGMKRKRSERVCRPAGSTVPRCRAAVTDRRPARKRGGNVLY